MTDKRETHKTASIRTPGEWYTEFDPSLGAYSVKYDSVLNGTMTTVVVASDLPIEDAALIAAAPKLLECARKGREACMILADECSDDNDDRSAVIWHRKAIACATAIAEAEGRVV